MFNPDFALAFQAGLAATIVGEFERGSIQAQPKTVDRLRRALEAAGVIFVAENGDGPGVKLRKMQEDHDKIDEHFESLVSEVANLRPAAFGELSPVKAIPMRRTEGLKNDLAIGAAKVREGRAKAGRLRVAKELPGGTRPKGRTLSAHVSAEVSAGFDAYMKSLPEPRPAHRDALRHLIADWLTGHGFLKHRDDPDGANGA